MNGVGSITAGGSTLPHHRLKMMGQGAAGDPTRQRQAIAARPGFALAMIATLCLASGCVEPTGDLELRWTIGAAAAADPDRSLDSCDEVGAKQTRIVPLSGPTRLAAETVPCQSARGQFHSLPDVRLGAWKLSLQLLDGSAEPLTSPETVMVTVTETRGLGRVNFSPAAFRNAPGKSTLLKGDYVFRLRVDGRSCVRLSPSLATQRIRLTTLGGDRIKAKVCAGQRCAATDGIESLPCIGDDQDQTIANLDWGQYKLEIFGQNDRGQTCWASATTIFVGVGTNPAVLHEITTKPECKR